MGEHIRVRLTRQSARWQPLEHLPGWDPVVTPHPVPDAEMQVDVHPPLAKGRQCQLVLGAERPNHAHPTGISRGQERIPVVPVK